MFDVGFSELIVIAIVALVVIGPERLPKVARTAGHLLGRLQRYVNDVKSDISREMQLDELKKLQAEVQESARSFERSISSEVQSLEQSVDQVTKSLSHELAPPADASDLPLAPLEGSPALSSPVPPGASSAPAQKV